MLSSEYDMFQQGIVVRVDKARKNATAGKISNFVDSWNRPLSEEVEVDNRDHGFIVERSYFDESDSMQSDSGSESRISHPSISSISSSPNAKIPIKYELIG
jgi:hypothetical protein